MSAIIAPDIHGHQSFLDFAIQQYDIKKKTDPYAQLIFLGDLIDRGPRSKLCLTNIFSLLEKDHNVHLCMGNHEWMMLQSLYHEDFTWLPTYLSNGGVETLMEYANFSTQNEGVDFIKECASVEWKINRFLSGDLTAKKEIVDLVNRICEFPTLNDHMQKLLANAVDYVITHDGVLCSHAMIPMFENPLVENLEDLKIRKESVPTHIHGRPFRMKTFGPKPPSIKYTVHGHTPVQQIVMGESIVIDLGGFKTNRYCVLDTETKTILYK